MDKQSLIDLQAEREFDAQFGSAVRALILERRRLIAKDEEIEALKARLAKYEGEAAR